MLRRVLCALGLMLLPSNVFGQGPLLWEVEEDFHGWSDTAEAIALSGKFAVITGDADVGGSPQDLVVQGFRKKNGILQWSHQDTFAQGVSHELIVTHKKTAFVASNPEQGLVVRAYDTPSGTLLWENAARDVWFIDVGGDIAASPTAVAIIGSANATLVTRAYDPATGALLWEDRAGMEGVSAFPAAVAVNRNRVFVAGSYAGALLVRAFDALSGNVEWEFSRPGATATTLALAAGRVFVAGSENGFRGPTYLAALSAKTGEPLWEGDAPLDGRFFDLAINGSRLVGLAFVGSGSAVQSYDADTGTLQWEDILMPPPGIQTSVRARAVALNDNAVYVGGGLSDFPSYSELMVRAYDAETGTLLWDDRSHPSPFIFGEAGPLDAYINSVVLGKNRLFVAGSAAQPSDNPVGSFLDFIVRAYDIRGDRTGP